MLNMATMVIEYSDLAVAVNGLFAIKYPDRIGMKRRLQILASSVQLGTNSLNQKGSITLATSSKLSLKSQIPSNLCPRDLVTLNRGLQTS
ncbi:hypothetical protein C1H46_038151 [Malus baccata]|uniref:Uncharacterized protein n=1 Tax=Malus baccata TaxID=106549 RepID=A0A540KQ35_MALBA|nr:hypothetical protein C1H46_038151 [Malus baccata]